jgi:hypothetical protein
VAARIGRRLQDHIVDALAADGAIRWPLGKDGH